MENVWNLNEGFTLDVERAKRWYHEDGAIDYDDVNHHTIQRALGPSAAEYYYCHSCVESIRDFYEGVNETFYVISFGVSIRQAVYLR